MRSWRSPRSRRSSLVLLVLAALVVGSLGAAIGRGRSEAAPKRRAAARHTPVSPVDSFYAASSPFNRLIPSNPVLDPQSPELVALLAQVGMQGGFAVAVRRYTVPVYYATATTPRQRVALTASWAPRHVMIGVPIPPGTAPDPGTDGHVAIVDQSNGCEYDFWRMQQQGSGWAASWGNTLKLSGSGIYRHGLSARASGFGLLAGLIMPAELRRGRIDHALVFSYPYTSSAGFVKPATEDDGRSTLPAALAEGARLQLDPAFDSAKLPRYERVIAQALQRYGMYLADTGGVNVSLYAANPQAYRRNPYAGVLPDDDYVQLPGIPLDRFRVLAQSRPMQPRNLRVVATGCARLR